MTTTNVSNKCEICNDEIPHQYIEHLCDVCYCDIHQLDFNVVDDMVEVVEACDDEVEVRVDSKLKLTN